MFWGRGKHEQRRRGCAGDRVGQSNRDVMTLGCCCQRGRAWPGFGKIGQQEDFGPERKQSWKACEPESSVGDEGRPRHHAGWWGLGWGWGLLPTGKKGAEKARPMGIGRWIGELSYKVRRKDVLRG